MTSAEFEDRVCRPLLSTPSLGITIETMTCLTSTRCAAFNSLSRDHRPRRVTKVPSIYIIEVFQLPLSGSRVERVCRVHFLMNKNLSTPSLGITTIVYLTRDRGGIVLSTPSLGITCGLLSNRAQKVQFMLSTPSLGITEPDSGIFRLSAAFCRGTPSHK